jgi:hypothetical protein
MATRTVEMFVCPRCEMGTVLEVVRGGINPRHADDSCGYVEYRTEQWQVDDEWENDEYPSAAECDYLYRTNPDFRLYADEAERIANEG